jgi:hypothetical protein
LQVSDHVWSLEKIVKLQHWSETIPNETDFDEMVAAVSGGLPDLIRLRLL